MYVSSFFVFVDVGQNLITVPGMLAAAHVKEPIDIEEGISKDSLVYFFGHTSPAKNIPLYKKQVDVLSGEVVIVVVLFFRSSSSSSGLQTLCSKSRSEEWRFDC